MSLLQDIEGILKTNNLNYLTVIEKRYAIPVKVYRAINSVTNDVYGKDAGEENYYPFEELEALVIGDDFFPSDLYSSGGFNEGWLFTSSDCIILPADRIDITRDDNRTRRYHIESIVTLGTSKVVFKKIKLSALGD